MDFIDFCNKILFVLNEQKYNIALSPLELAKIIYPEYNFKRGIWGTSLGNALNIALSELNAMKFIVNRGVYLNITDIGTEVLVNPHNLWEPICKVILNEEEEKLLKLINRLSPQYDEKNSFVLLDQVERNAVLNEFNLSLPAIWKNPDEKLKKILAGLPYRLSSNSFIRFYGNVGDFFPRMTSSYKGLVWETRRDITKEANIIDKLLSEWETTNVEFKQELNLDTNEQKGNFIKDVLSLVNTKSSGERYMIIGFNDNTQQYHGSPDPSVTQERIENILKYLTYPVVQVRFRVIEYKKGKVGKLEIIREANKLPYRATRTVYGNKKKVYLKKDSVYVRHNTLNTELSDINGKMHPELIALVEEGELARKNMLLEVIKV